MATFAVGDIHGHDEALDEVLAKISVELDAGDTVVFLGDIIDRGPSPKRCIERILTFRSSTAARVVALLGNHEDWLLRTFRDHTRHSWLLQMDAFDTIASYSRDAARALSSAVASLGPRLVSERVVLPYDVFFDAVPPAHLDFFEELVTHCRTPEGVFVHGGLDSAIRVLDHQPREALLWGTADFPNDYRGPETVVYGHWGNVRLNEVGWPVPAVVGKTIGIDSIAHGVLTAVRLPDRRVFQGGRLVSPL
jgi:serine/threonine protein phosphatase 1